MDYKRMSWQEYEQMLISNNYTEEQIEEIKKIRESDEYELVNWEQYTYLTQNHFLKRFYKLKKKRSVYGKDSKFYFLNHQKRAFDVCAQFKEE